MAREDDIPNLGEGGTYTIVPKHPPPVMGGSPPSAAGVKGAPGTPAGPVPTKPPPAPTLSPNAAVHNPIQFPSWFPSMSSVGGALGHLIPSMPDEGMGAHSIKDPVTGNWYYPQVKGGEDPQALPGVGGKGGPAPGAIKTRTPRHWEEGPPDRYGNTQFLRRGDLHYINPGQELYDPESGRYYRWGERGQGGGYSPSEHVAPSRRTIFGQLGRLFGGGTPTSPGWQVTEGQDGDFRSAKAGEVPEKIGGERVRGRGEHGGLTFDPETGQYEPASVAGEEHRSGGRHHHGGGGGYGGAPFNPQQFMQMLGGMRGMPPIMQFILRMLMAQGGGARPPFGPGGTTGSEGGTAPGDHPTGDPADPYGRKAGMDRTIQQMKKFLQDHPEAKKWVMSQGIDLSPFDDNNVPAPVGGSAPGSPAGGASSGGPNAAPATAPASPGGAPAAPVATGASGASATPPATAGAAPGNTQAPGESEPSFLGMRLPGYTYRGGGWSGAANGGTPHAAAPGPPSPAQAALQAGAQHAAADPAPGVQTASLDPSIGVRSVGKQHGSLPTISRERQGKETAALSGAAGYNFGKPFNPRLAQARSKFADELRAKPWLRQKFLQIMYNEQGSHPQGTQSVAETALNRAIIRGTSLERQLKWHGHERGGYYQVGNMGRGSEKYMAQLNRALDNALAGSNIADYATDNSSGDLARRERASGKFRYRSGYHGETFFAPGWGEPQFSRAWDNWIAQMTAPEVAGP